VTTYNLGGVMIYRIEMDDFGNNCGDGPFPLTAAMSAGLETGGPLPDISWGPDNGGVREIPHYAFLLLPMVR